MNLWRKEIRQVLPNIQLSYHRDSRRHNHHFLQTSARHSKHVQNTWNGTNLLNDSFWWDGRVAYLGYSFQTSSSLIWCCRLVKQIYQFIQRMILRKNSLSKKKPALSPMSSGDPHSRTHTLKDKAGKNHWVTRIRLEKTNLPSLWEHSYRTEEDPRPWSLLVYPFVI